MMKKGTMKAILAPALVALAAVIATPAMAGGDKAAEKKPAAAQMTDKAAAKTGREAVEHVVAIPAGLASMVVGETQIAAQFKEAFELARRHGTLGKVLDRLYQFALRAAKRVRTETEVSKTPLSVSYIAVLLVRKVFGELEGVRVLVVGAGETAELTARYLKEERAEIFVTNRTFARAVELAERVGGGVVEWNRFKEFLKEVDVAIFSTSAGSYLLKKEEAERTFRKREGPVVLVDLSVPRNVEPSVGDLEGVFLLNVDDLKEIARKNLQRRLKEAQKGLLIVKEETEKFLRELERIKLAEVLKGVKEKVDRLWELGRGEDPERAAELFKNRLLAAIFDLIKENPEAGRLLDRRLQKLLKELKERV